MNLSPEQNQIFQTYLQGKNVFLTGPGGSGKTAIIRHIYHHAINNYRTISVCALTGCAAQLLECNARTIHSWAGIGLASGTIDDCIRKIVRNKFKKKIWQTTEILIIDEISMMSMKLFDLLNLIGKRVRKCYDKPFGGLQILLSGDFYQLPPVSRDAVSDPDSGRFCFESADWWTIFGKENSIELKKIYRQTDDVYATILNELREGIIKKRSILLLSQQLNKEKPADLFIQPTKLFPRRDQVDFVNASEMEQISGEPKTFSMIPSVPSALLLASSTQTITEEDLERELKLMENGILCDSVLHLKVGAQVMCIVNSDFPIYKKYYLEHYHDNEKTIEYGNGNTNNNEQGTISLYNGSQGIITSFHPTNGFPIVRFYKFPTCEVIVAPYTWESERIDGVNIKQIPLLLSWAITIHKSQGATLEYAEIDVGKSIFEDGQTYVALSRVCSLEGLYLSAFDYTKIRINNKVKEFYGHLHKL